MSRDLRDALDVLEKEKNISKDTLLEAIEQSLIQACKNHFGKADNVHVMIDPETCDFSVYADRTVVEHVEDPALEISLVDAQKTNTNAEIGDVMKVEIQSKEFGRIATQNAKNVILQKIREEERKVLYDQYYGIEKEVVTGIVQRVMGKNVSINLGKADAVLTENEQVKGETFQPTERVKVYILEGMRSSWTLQVRDAAHTFVSQRNAWKRLSKPFSLKMAVDEVYQTSKRSLDQLKKQ